MLPGQQMNDDRSPTRRARFRDWSRPSLDPERLKRFIARLPWRSIIEIALLGLWAIFVGRAYLNLDPSVWPSGRETGVQLYPHHFWTEVQRCGLCALWDGSVNGGVPAIANPAVGLLHPLVMISTLLAGVMNGAKIGLIGALWMAGLAQWWIARSLKLGWLPRVWSGAMAIAGGHLAARMATDEFTMVLSIAACSLALAGAVHLAVTGRRRATVLLALTGALAIVAGQGYVQLALVSWAPAFLFVILGKGLRPRPVWREYALALVLSLLVAAVFLVPLVHFLPNFAKEADPSFAHVQPIEYAPLNWVIRDFSFLRADILGKFDAPELFGMYIGWVPVLLAILTLRFARREDRSILLCLAAGLVISVLMGSAIPLKVLVQISGFFGGFRNASLMGTLAIPPLLAFAAYGLDGLIKLAWPQLSIALRGIDRPFTITISLAVILIVPLGLALYTAFDFTRIFYTVDNMAGIYKSYANAKASLKTAGLQWVALPFGEHYQIEPALSLGLKLTNVANTASWQGRAFPLPRTIVSRAPITDTQTIGRLDDIPIYLYPDRDYAYVETSDHHTPCSASGEGGDLFVTCTNDTPGTLVMQEFSFNGWGAQRDGASVPLIDNNWLSVDAPAGTHTYEFHYRPWDVAVGLIITVFGLVLCAWLWVRAPDRRLPPEPPMPLETD